jgi:hypothetical protein
MSFVTQVITRWRNTHSSTGSRSEGKSSTSRPRLAPAALARQHDPVPLFVPVTRTPVAVDRPVRRWSGRRARDSGDRWHCGSPVARNPREQARLVRQVYRTPRSIAEVFLPATLNCSTCSRMGAERRMAPQAGLEPATLRLTGGKDDVSCVLLDCAARC